MGGSIPAVGEKSLGMESRLEVKGLGVVELKRLLVENRHNVIHEVLWLWFLL